MSKFRLSLEKIIDEKGRDWYDKVEGEAIKSHHLYAEDVDGSVYVSAFVRGRYMKEKLDSEKRRNRRTGREIFFSSRIEYAS